MRELHPPDIAVTLNYLGNVLSDIGDSIGARTCYEQSLEINRDLLGHTHPGTVTSQINLGCFLGEQGEYAAARLHLEAALSTNKKLHGHDHPDTAITLNHLGVLLHSQGSYTAAQTYYEQALAIRKNAFGVMHLDTATSLSNLGSLLRAMGKPIEALPYLEQSLTVFRKLQGSGHPETATILNNVGEARCENGDYAGAKACLEESLSIRAKVLGLKNELTASSIHNLACYYYEIGDRIAARRYFEQALSIRKDVLGIKHPITANSLTSYGSILSDMGELAGARKCYEQALEIRLAVLGNDHPEVAMALGNLAVLLDDLGEATEARRMLEQAIKMVHDARGEQHPDTALLCNNLASVLQSQGAYAEARDYLERCLAIYVNLYGEKHASSARSVSNIGYAIGASGDYLAATAYLKKALAIQEEVLGANHPTTATILNNLGSTMQRIGEYVDARAYFQRALTIRLAVFGESHPETVSSFSNLGFVHACTHEYVASAKLLARVSAFENDYRESVCAGSSEAESLNFLARGTRTQDAMISVWRHGDLSDDDLYGHLWPGRAAVFQLMASRQRELEKSVAPEVRALYQTWLDVRREVARLTLAPADPDLPKMLERRDRIEQLVQRKERLERELADKLPNFANEQALLRRPHAELIQALPTDATFIDVLRYARFEHDPKVPGKKGDSWTPSYVAFILEHGRPVKRIDLGPAAAIDQAAKTWRQEIVERRTGQAAEELRRLVWQPIEATLSSAVQTVYLVPDGPLSSIPWAALPGKNAGTVLLEDYALALVVNGQVLLDQLLHESPTSERDQVLAVGGVQYDAAPAEPKDASFLAGLRMAALDDRMLVRWPALPGTLDEIDEAGRLAGKRSVVKLTGGEADTGRVLKELPHAHWAVLATHGFFADPKLRSALQFDEAGFEKRQFLMAGERTTAAGRNPLLLSGLVFAGANLPRPVDDFGIPHGDGGILTAEAIAGLNLSQMQLAVLSACETGLGDVAGGEGIFGLQRAFHQAGCRNVVASLWKVDDQATSAVMRLFYYQLWQEHKSPLAALREAQLTLYRHPELIGQLASSRGPNFGKLVELADVGKPKQNAPTADVRLWAAFVLSGAGQ